MLVKMNLTIYLCQNLTFIFFKKMRKIFFSVCCFVAVGIRSLSLVSCNSCTEEAASRLYDANWDLDGDGDYGDRSGSYNPSFQGRDPYYAECSHCSCKFFVAERSGSTTCVCGHSKFSHVKRYH